MIFTVVYLPSAEDELADIWLKAADRQAVADASNAIDRLLRDDGHLRGQPFFGERILGAAPLAVVFSVSLDDRLVKVLQVQEVG